MYRPGKSLLKILFSFRRKTSKALCRKKTIPRIVPSFNYEIHAASAHCFVHSYSRYASFSGLIHSGTSLPFFFIVGAFEQASAQDLI